MRRILLATLLNLGLTISVQTAIAQPAPPNPPTGQVRLISGLSVESVTVVGVKPSEETIKNFVDTRAAPTPVLNKMARWTSRLCPVTIGLGDTYAKYVTQRIRDVATAVGAPVNADPGCHPNIEVVFTASPQALLDKFREQQPLLLGYHSDTHDVEQMATVTHPIQAWYATETIDYDGTRMVQDLTCRQSGVTLNEHQTPSKQLLLPCAVAVHSSGSRLNNGLSNGFYNVLIVAEPAKLLDYEIGSLADYVIMLALSQPASLDSCQVLPSISNMLARSCASIPNRITDGDLAYLRALYKMPDGTGLEIQRNEIRLEMKKTLVTNKGGPN
jgi:hypothetical protein